MEGFGVLVGLLLTLALVIYAGRHGFRKARGCELAGVCCGTAHRLNLPENAMKIIAVLLFFLTGGWAIIAYIFAALCWDSEPGHHTTSKS